MRLIDVDNFKKNNPEYLQLDIDYVTEVTVEDVLDCEPTVKAIPIEYIQKWNNNYIADTMRNGRTIINQMLVDWEKENERDV